MDRFVRHGASPAPSNATGLATIAPTEPSKSSLPESDLYSPPSPRITPPLTEGFPVKCFIKKVPYILRRYLKNLKRRCSAIWHPNFGKEICRPNGLDVYWLCTLCQRRGKTRYVKAVATTDAIKRIEQIHGYKQDEFVKVG